MVQLEIDGVEAFLEIEHAVGKNILTLNGEQSERFAEPRMQPHRQIRTDLTGRAAREEP